MEQRLAELRVKARARLATARTLLGLPRKAAQIERCLSALLEAETLLAAEAYHRGVGADEAHLERTCPAWTQVQTLREQASTLMHSFLDDLEQLDTRPHRPSIPSTEAGSAGELDRIAAHYRDLAEHFSVAHLGELTLRERHFLNSRFLQQPTVRH